MLLPFAGGRPVREITYDAVYRLIRDKFHCLKTICLDNAVGLYWPFYFVYVAYIVHISIYYLYS